MSSEQTREPQYQPSLEIRDRQGLTSLGLMTNQVWHDDPKRLAFVLARYKFTAKMLSGKRRVLEVGCGDAFASRLVAQEVGALCVIDFDPVFISDIEARRDTRWPLESRVHDILQGPAGQDFDAAYSLDVIEHIPQAQEQLYMRHIATSLTSHGVFIVGTPSLESQSYASPASREGHVNCKTGPQLKTLMEASFQNVFLFSMNDEVVHTGFTPMAHYLLAIGAGVKARI